MTKFIGAILGLAHVANSGAPGSLTDPFFSNGRVVRMLSDYVTATPVANDTISLGFVDWTTRFDAISAVDFDAFGTGVTLDVGVASNPANVGAMAPACLIAAQSIATPAGTASLLKSVPIAKRRQPLWQLAGYASAQAARTATVAVGGRAELIATIKGGTPVNGTVAWSIYGSPQ